MSPPSGTPAARQSFGDLRLTYAQLWGHAKQYAQVLRDLGTKDEDGYVTIVDRKKDMVLRGDFNVYPRQVEEVLLRHPALGQVAVIGLPDPEQGEEVCAVVVKDPEGGDVTEQELTSWSREQLAGYEYPRRAWFTDSLPLGPSGKVLERELVQQYGADS